VLKLIPHTFYLLLCILFLNLRIEGQTKSNSVSSTQSIESRRQFVASGDIFGTRVFVENKGQFDDKTNSDQKIYYALDNGLEQIYFTKSGLIYKQSKSAVLDEEYLEALEKGKKIREQKTEVYYTNMEWIGADIEKIEIESSLQQSHYITYGGKELNSNTFKKLIYKNVYKNIDIEYTIPEDKGYGIKYNLILHPGAKVEDVKILYKGDVKKISLNKNGEVIIKTSLDDIIEHTPKTFDLFEHEIISGYTLNKDTIGFSLGSGYNKNETTIIDPWVSAVTTLSNNNAAYDVDYDFGGNTFIYGGANSFKVAMYNVNGALQWTFSGTVTSIGWTSLTYVSNFGINKFTSKSFIGQGFNNNGVQVIRIDANGNFDNFVNTANTQYKEVWDMGFHCITGDVFILGGGTSSNISAATINTVNSSLVLSTFQPTNNGAGQDVVSHAIDDQGNIFINYAGSAGLNNKICRVTTSFTNNVWTMPSNYTTFNEIQNKNSYINPGSSNGFNCLAVNANYLFYYDGFNLAAYNKNTGSVTASTTVSGLSVRQQGGIAVDDCNNIYIGGNGSILTYTFNGTTFSTLTPIALNASTTSQYVWDIKLNRNTKILFVCGSGFVGTYSAAISSTCAVPLGLCVFNQAGVAVSSSSITCATLGSATVSANGGTGPFTYTWIPSGQTGSVGTNLMPGTYTILVYDTGSNSNYTTTTTFISPVPLTGTIANSFILNCNGASNGTAAIANLAGGSGSQTYTWTNGITAQNTPSIGGLSAGNYTVRVMDGLTNCVFTNTFNILQPSLVGSMIFISHPTVCAGQSSTITALGTGGSPGYNFNWLGGSNTDTYVVTSSTAGINTYTVYLSDQSACSTTGVATVTFVANPILTVSNPNICPFETATLTASGATSYTWNNTTTGNPFFDTPSTNQTYTLTGSALGCTSTTTINIFIKSIPVPILSSNNPVCNGNNLIFSATGGTSSVWSGPQFYSSLLQTNTIIAASPAHSGLYNVTVTAANSCTANASINLTVHPTPTLSAIGSTVCSNQVLNLSANSVVGASYYWMGPNNFNSVFQNPSIQNPVAGISGNYTVRATSAQGCTNTSIAQVTVTTLPITFPHSNSPLCFGDVLQLNGNNTTGAQNYNWQGPNGFISLLQNPNINNISTSASGIYTITVSAGPCVRSNTTMVTVNNLPSPIASNNGPVCENNPLDLQVATPPNNSIIGYVWQGPNNYLAYVAQARINTTQLMHAGIYTIMVTDVNGCRNISTTTVNINSNPIVTAIGDTVCLNDPAELKALGANTFAWYSNTGNISNAANAIIFKANSVVPTTYTVIGTSVNNCTASATAILNTWALPQPSLTVAPKDKICVFKTFDLEGEGALTYLWEGPMNRQYTGKRIQIVANALSFSGEYTLTGIDIHNCKASITVPLTVYNLPQGQLSKGMKGACVPFTSEFVFSPNIDTYSLTSFNWFLDGRTYSTTAFVKNFNKAGNYPLIAKMTDINGCSNSMSFMINAWPQPIADFTFAPTKPIENLNEVEFNNTSTSINITEWNWFFAPELNQKTGFISNKENTNYLFKDAGKYPVALVIKNEFGCADSVVKVIEVLEDFNVFVPTAFTPNGDKHNELFMPVTRGIREYQFYVFDRWNELMYNSTDPNTGWDGTHRGVACKQDVYVWKLIVTSKNGEQRIYTGEVSLIK